MANNVVNTKAYTLSRLIKEVSGISRRQGQSATGIYSALSPVLGATSVKFFVMNQFLNGQLEAVLRNHSSVSSLTGRASTPRARLLNALKARKKSS